MIDKRSHDKYPRNHAYFNHKFAVIDGRDVVTGSFNWTVNAERQNRENLVVLDCPELAQAFSAEWESIQRDKP